MTIPDEILWATQNGDVSTVRRWLEGGGDPNQNLAYNGDHVFYPGFRLLLIATSNDHRAIVSALLEHGADVNYLFRYPSYSDTRSGDNALSLAAGRSNLFLARLLLENGAASSAIGNRALESPRFLRMFLMAGGDVSAPTTSGKIPEQYARERLDYYQTHRDSNYSNYQATAATYAESLRILEGTRLAGSYKNYVLQEYKELLRLRSLLARKRASINDQAPEVVARLFGGRTDATRPARRRGRTLPPRTAGVPDPAFWLVMEYWRLGDWRHPERHP